MYHPLGQETGLEWVELHNQMAVDEDLSDWTLDGGIEYRFPQGTVFTPESIWRRQTDDLQTGYGALGLAGRLMNGGDRLVLRNLNRRLMDELNTATKHLACSCRRFWSVASKRWPGTPAVGGKLARSRSWGNA